jgi:hypothetical protein
MHKRPLRHFSTLILSLVVLLMALWAQPAMASHTAPEVSDNSGWAPGWNLHPAYYSTVQFPDGDGKADACGRGHAGIYCAINNGTSFGTATLWTWQDNQFSDTHGWNSHPPTIGPFGFPTLTGMGRQMCNAMDGGGYGGFDRCPMGDPSTDHPSIAAPSRRLWPALARGARRPDGVSCGSCGPARSEKTSLRTTPPAKRATSGSNDERWGPHGGFDATASSWPKLTERTTPFARLMADASAA